MPRDNRMSRSLHALIHLDRHVKRATSEAMAKMLGTNPVVVRRMMSGLREKGYVVSEKGHGGGWELQVELSAITLLDVYQAMGSPALFSIGPAADPSPCLVEHAVDECWIRHSMKRKWCYLIALAKSPWRTLPVITSIKWRNWGWNLSPIRCAVNNVNPASAK